MKSNFPPPVKACLWSHITNDIDIQVHKNLIIHNILNRGTYEAVLWMRNAFTDQDIVTVIKKSSSSNWNKKSLALWSLVFRAYPQKVGRFL